MSKQSSFIPETEIERAHRPPKRRKGKYELWVKFRSMSEWWCWHKYETLELAEQNKAKKERERYLEGVEIRVKE